MKRLGMAMLAAGMLVSMLAGAAQAEVLVNQRTEILAGGWNYCSNAEYVLLSGTVHQTFRLTTNDNTTQLGIYNNFANMRGTSDSGTEYVATNADHMEQTVVLTNGATETTIVARNNLISQGPTPNLEVRFTFHITVNANGDVTATVDSFGFYCRG